MQPNTNFASVNTAVTPNVSNTTAMYNIDNTVEAPKSNQPMPAGINQNVRLLGVFFEALRQDGTGGNVLKFNFEDAAGRRFRHTEFEVDVERERSNAQQWGKDPDKQVRNALMGLSGRIKHIMSCFLPADKVVIQGNTWDEFGGNIVTMLGEAYKGIDVRVKLILNNKDYCMFPKQAFRPFIQRMDTPDSLAIEAKYERIEPKGTSASASGSDLDALLSAAPTPAAPVQDFAAPTAAPAPWDEVAASPTSTLSAPDAPAPTGDNNDDLVF
jgi:hypothetical protein